MPIDFAIVRQDRDFSCRADGARAFPVGRKVSFRSGGITRVGLANDHLKPPPQAVYDPSAYRAQHGFWADFLAPTVSAESGGSFIALNTYDRAAFTFGFAQFAAHTPDGDFVRWFRAMLERAEAQDYFPNLAVQGGRIHSMELDDDVALESAQSTERLQAYLNEAATIVDDREVIAAAKLIHWTTHHAGARDLQVLFAVDLARRRVQRADQRLRLDGRAAGECFVIFDILHQGRGGSDTFPRLDALLRERDPLAALLTVGKDEYPSRIAKLRKAIDAEPQFASLRWSSAARSFA
ncbi:MAG: hypothetical protein AB7O45_07875 [Alphaproteobacteria bacterium]